MKDKLVECSFSELTEAVEGKKTNVKTFNSRKTLPIATFSDFLAGKYQQAVEVSRAWEHRIRLFPST